MIDKTFVEYIVEQIQGVESVSYKYMFGGCAIYCGNKVVEEPPYPGAKPFFLVDNKIDDKEWLCKLVLITAKELPDPKMKKIKV